MAELEAAAEVNKAIPKGEDQGIRGVNVVIIDNYDSFTWNLYQYLCILGANVTVVRSQECTLDELVARHSDITHLVISPGPGHPLRDSGISIPALQHYAGKIPVFGVCMGLQCMYAAYGGIVEGAGEIVHGKTSEVRHDGKGLFTGVSQNIKCTRYHSLAARVGTLPSDMEFTSWTGGNPTQEDNGVVMGIRHKVHAMEAVQYHPESILTESGQALMINFLRLRGGTWAENSAFGVGDATTKGAGASSAASRGMPSTSAPLPTILQRICKERLEDVKKAKTLPGSSPSDLRARLALHVPPPQIDFYKRLSAAVAGPGGVALMAEIKRASPSKGSFVTDTTPSPPEIALSYALAGASTISVLTEPVWFHGTLQDMLNVRLCLEGLIDRPAILRKDFILDPYQIDEARCYGADTVLLIVACLDDERLKLLYDRALALGMEPLVEVNNAAELEMALNIGAKIIGVNNRNLHDFSVDMGTTSRLADVIRAHKGNHFDVIMCALSGITGRGDVQRYIEEGVGAVLVGEALMKAENKGGFVRELLGTSLSPNSVNPSSVNGIAAPQTSSTVPLVKICGMTDPEEAMAAVEAGADMIGLIFAIGSKRRVDYARAQQIASAVRAATFNRLTTPSDPTAISSNSHVNPQGAHWFTFQANRLSNALRQRPLIVGVFQNTSLAEIIQAIDAVPLDVVQLHGTEPTEWARIITVPVIRAFHVGRDIDQHLREVSRPGYHAIPLLDTATSGLQAHGASGLSGGAGRTFDWSIAKKVGDRETELTKGTATERLPVILAGGLTPVNVVQAVHEAQPWCVDVSGGVEREGEPGHKDIEKIRQFIKLVKKGVEDATDGVNG